MMSRLLRRTALVSITALALTSAAFPMPRDTDQGGINILFATYGATCSVVPGNVTDAVKNECDGRRFCAYKVDHRVIGDPSPGCRKDFKVIYVCGYSDPRIESAAPEASGATLTLRCR